jgi:hypothetical protein
MLRNRMIALFLSATICGVGSAASLSAATLSGSHFGADSQVTRLSQAIAWKHGHRAYRHPHGRYRHFHNGFYYRNPWWTVPLALPGAVTRAVVHTNWCLDHYKSYDPESDTYMGYDGERHRCIGP